MIGFFIFQPPIIGMFMRQDKPSIGNPNAKTIHGYYINILPPKVADTKLGHTDWYHGIQLKKLRFGRNTCFFIGLSLGRLKGRFLILTSSCHPLPPSLV